MAQSTEFEGLDPEIVSKLRILEQIKEKAVQQERFDDAKKIKENIERMRGFGVHINQLEERKRMATMNEDYDAAKMIKIEIDKVRGAMFNPFIEELIIGHLGVSQNTGSKTP